MTHKELSMISKVLQSRLGYSLRCQEARLPEFFCYSVHCAVLRHSRLRVYARPSVITRDIRFQLPGIVPFVFACRDIYFQFAAVLVFSRK